MIAFEFGKPSVVELSELSVGDFLMFDEPGGPATVCAMTPNIGQKISLLTLGGGNAFRVLPLESRYRHSALKIEIAAASMRFRIDQASAVQATHETAYTLGNIVLPLRESPGIVVSFPESERRAPFSLSPNGWVRAEIDMPKFVFTRWALSYIDESGQWVDLARHNGETSVCA